MSYYWGSTGGSKMFSTPIEKWTESNVSIRTITFLKYIYENNLIISSLEEDYKDDYFNYLKKSFPDFDLNDSTLTHFYSQSIFVGFVKKNKNNIYLTESGISFVESIIIGDFEKSNDIFLDSIMRISYPNSDIGSKIYGSVLFPFSILFRYILDNNSIETEFIYKTLIFSSGRKDLEKMTQEPGNKEKKIYNWFIRSLISMGYLDEEFKSIKINNYYFKHIKDKVISNDIEQLYVSDKINKRINIDFFKGHFWRNDKFIPTKSDQLVALLYFLIYAKTGNVGNKEADLRNEYKSIWSSFDIDKEYQEGEILFKRDFGRELTRNCSNNFKNKDNIENKTRNYFYNQNHTYFLTKKFEDLFIETLYIFGIDENISSLIFDKIITLTNQERTKNVYLKKTKDTSKALEGERESFKFKSKKDKDGNKIKRDPKNVLILRMFVEGHLEGKCQLCNESHFIKENHDPYFEAHHIKPLYEGGPDKLENMISLCANCHRRAHFENNKEKIKKILYNKSQERSNDINWNLLIDSIKDI